MHAEVECARQRVRFEVGAQFGAHTGQRMRAERLRLLLGLLVFAVGLRFAYDLIVIPDDLYSIRIVRSE